jgi:hypothetical protein
VKKHAHIGEVGGLLMVPGRKSARGNLVAIMQGQDGYGDPVFSLVEVWETGGTSSLGKKTWRTLGEARAANPPVGRTK